MAMAYYKQLSFTLALPSNLLLYPNAKIIIKKKHHHVLSASFSTIQCHKGSVTFTLPPSLLPSSIWNIMSSYVPFLGSLICWLPLL